MVRYARRAAALQQSLRALPGGDSADAAALAAVDAGLKPGALSKDELIRFRGKRPEYLEAR